jgi:hypothetical protein
VNILKEDGIVTAAKEVQVPLADENPTDTAQVKGKKSKESNGRSKGNEKSKGKVPDRQCVVM